MAVVDQTGAQMLAGFAGADRSALVGRIVEMLRKEFREDVWRFYREHEDEAVFTYRQKVLGIVPVSIAIRYRHIRRVFELLVGPEPMHLGPAA